MNVTRSDWERYFPFDRIRPQQADAIDAALHAFLSDRKKYCILQGETGVGKSAIAVTIARVLASMNNVDGLRSDGAYVLTTQKILQQQYIDDFSSIGMHSIKSASSYPCSRAASSCGEIRRVLKVMKDRCDASIADCKSDCKYLDEKRAFVSSMLGVTNYSYFLSETMYAGTLKPRQLLVCDEAHNIENSLSNHIQISFSTRFAARMLEVKPPVRFDVLTALGWVRDAYKPALLVHIAETTAKISRALASENVDELTLLAKENERLDKHVCKVNRFLNDFVESNWVLNVVDLSDGYHSLDFKPVDVSHFADDRLFRFGEHVLCMSATILDHETFCRSVGIPVKDAVFMRAPSPFSVENRLVHFMPVGSMSRKSIDETLPKLVEAIKIILEQHKGEKGIIHAQSFRIANYIKSHVRSKRLLIHDSENRSAVLEQHKLSEKPTVLLSPSMAEGVDLAGDCSRFQIICKVPYPSLNDAVVVKRMKNDQRWYDLVTARTLIQSLGRSIRHEEDFAVSYILDGDWNRFYAKNKHMFSGDFEMSLR